MKCERSIDWFLQNRSTSTASSVPVRIATAKPNSSVFTQTIDTLNRLERGSRGRSPASN